LWVSPARGLAAWTLGIILETLWMSLGMVAFLVPATLSGLGIGPAVALHGGSTLVVFNALRLLAYKEPSAYLLPSVSGAHHHQSAGPLR